MKKTVLFITYLFPPTAGAGVYRSLKFTKYLELFGWNPVVLCARNSFSNPIDKSLESEIPENVEVHRILSGENPLWSFGPAALGLNVKWFHIPDEILLWKTFAYSKARQIIKEKNIDIVYSTSPPESTLLLGVKIKRKFNIPWVIDYRDPWTERCSYPTRFHRNHEENLERKVASLSDHIILNTEINRINYINKFNMPAEKCTAIMNGFDPDDFKGARSSSHNKKFTITYSGIFRKNYAPESLLYPLLDLARSDKRFAENAVFCKTGMNRWPFYKKMMSELGNIMEVREAGHIPYDESLEIMQGSDLLLFTLPSAQAGSKYYYDDARDVNGWVPSKLYNYLAARKNILAIAPKKSTVADIVNKTNAGKVVEPDNPDMILETLKEYFDDWRQNNLTYCPNETALEKYNRVNQTKELAALFDNVCARKND